jgi:putative membrane protein
VKIREYIIHILQGMLMGMAEIIPGVSGSALALMLGFYHRMIDVMDAAIQIGLKVPRVLARRMTFVALSQEVKATDWQFGVSLLVGFGVAAVVLSHAIDAVYESAPQYMQALFFGIITASIVVTLKNLKNQSLGIWLAVVVSAVSVFLLIGLRPTVQQTDPNLVFVFLVSLLAVCGMVLPGISGGYVLVIFGLYEYVIRSIKNFTILSASPKEIATLVIFGLGIAIGFIVAIRSIKIAFERYHDLTTAVMLGLMLGSLRGLWPFFTFNSAAEATYALPWEVANWWVIAVIALLGFTLIIGITQFAVRKSN